MCSRLIALFTCFFIVSGTAYAADGFAVTAEWSEQDGQTVVLVNFTMNPQHYIYASSYQVNGVGDTRLEALEVPPAERKMDPFSKEEVDVYAHSFSARYRLLNTETRPLGISVSYQGCNQTTCFLPESQEFVFREGAVDVGGGSGTVEDAVAAGSDWRVQADRFEVVGSETGYMSVKKALDFMKRSGEEGDGSSSVFAQQGLLAAIGLILLGGLALNLTPCVLPMLPINLAIIGAGVQAGSRRRGFLQGGAYGLGIAVTYGVLGLVVVLSGATFGSLNSSPWFNVGIAVIFLFLALGMFDVIHIDFTRFQRSNAPGTSEKKRGPWLALSMGVVAALLAGACVAPVVISVLIWSGDLYAKGIQLGLILPFVLGLGMALPWPFAGAGLSFLPKPGQWMIWVRNGFGVFILLTALYYGYMGYKIFSLSRGGDEASGAPAYSAEEENRRLAEQLQDAAEKSRMVLIDFGASWCKNCVAMENTTLRDPALLEALQDVEFIHYRAEQTEDIYTKPVLQYYSVLGLPTYVVLRPKDTSK
jgi:thiol:disulfide interchange protein